MKLFETVSLLSIHFKKTVGFSNGLQLVEKVQQELGFFDKLKRDPGWDLAFVIR